MSALCMFVVVLVASACSPRTRAPSPTNPAATAEPTAGEAAGTFAATERRDSRPGDLIQGFVAPSAGELAGRVVDADGDPVANAPVELVAKHGQRTVTTDARGRFKTQIDEPTMVVVYRGMQVTGSTVTTEQVDGEEAIVLREAERPVQLARPLSDPIAIPAYTAAIRDKNVWARAWLLLEVSETGTVARVKLLDPPGYDLDPIAVREAFKLEFEPARNRAYMPVPSLVVWKFDWPPSLWNEGSPRLPAKASKLPCRESADDTWYQMDKPYRDCSPPNLAAAIRKPWIDRPSQ